MTGSRKYGGISAEARQELRRDRLIEAAIEVYGKNGFHASSVQSVCDAAGLIKRYFYESFSDSADLLAACFRRVVDEFLMELAALAAPCPPGTRERLSLVVTGFFEAIRDDPARARLFLLDADGVSDGVTSVMRDAQAAMADLLLPTPPFDIGDAAAVLYRAGAVSGLATIASTWIATGYRFPIEDAVSAAVRLFTAGLAGSDDQGPTGESGHGIAGG